MTPEQFTYWLQGFCELNDKPPTVAQWKSIQEHLQQVFKKETPSVKHKADQSLVDSIINPWRDTGVRIC